MTRVVPKRASRRGKKQSGAGFRLSAGAWRAVGFVCLWSILLGGTVGGLHYLDTRVLTPAEPRACQLEWANLPDWLQSEESRWIMQGDDLSYGIVEYAALRPEDNFHNPDLCTRIATDLSGCPWVSEVRCVSKHLTREGEAVIRIDAGFRRPVALVEANFRVYAIDNEGVRLPVEYDPAYVDRERNCVITGVTQPIPDLGEAWGGQDLAAGIQLAHYLTAAEHSGSLPFRTAIRAIDVSNHRPLNANLIIQLRLPDSYIIWGEPPGQEDDVEPDAEKKLASATAIYTANGGAFPIGETDLRSTDPDAGSVYVRSAN